MSELLRGPWPMRTLLVLVGFLDVYGWSKVARLVAAGSYGSAVFWGVAAFALAHTLVLDWRKTLRRG